MFARPISLFLALCILFLTSCGGNETNSGVNKSGTFSEEAAIERSGGDQLVVGISLDSQQDEFEEVLEEILLFTTKNLPQGNSITVFDAYNNVRLGNFEVPNDASLSSSKAVIRHNAPALRRMIDAWKQNSSRNEGKILIRFPQFLEYIATNIHIDGRTTDVVVIGNPLYIDEREPSFSMSEGSFPSDGHINSSQRNSIYGVADKTNLLNGVNVYFVYSNYDVWNSDLHKVMVNRFWHYFIQNQGGSLKSFIGDLSTGVRNAGNRKVSNIRSFNPLATDRKREMWTVRRQVAQKRRDEVFGPNVAISDSIPQSRNGTINIMGIKWDCQQCDIDLYAKASPASEFLYYGRKNNGEGRFFKDYLTAPNPEQGLEYVEFFDPVDVEDVEVALNFYKGNAPEGVTGMFRIQFEGQIYEKEFKISANNGNRGRNIQNRDSDRHWANVVVSDVIPR